MLRLLYKMNILSSQQMRQVEAQLLKMAPPSASQLTIAKLGQSQPVTTPNDSILQSASQNTQHEIRKVVSLADNIKSAQTNDPNSALKVFTMAVLAIIYKGRLRKADNSSDSLLLDALKCSLYSPGISLNNIKNSPVCQNSNQMKALMATFFDVLANHQSKLAADVYKLAQIILHANQQLLNCFIAFFRCILVALQVEGANNWKTIMNGHSCLQHLLDYFDISYRIIGDLFLLYDEGVFFSVKEKEIVLGEYFQNEGERENEKKQLQIKQSIKLNMIQSYMLNVNQQEARRKKGIVDSDLKLFNFMLESCQDQLKSHPDTETPHFKDNDAFHFGKKKKEEVAYRPEEVRFQFEKLIKDESLQEIEPDDLINFNAQFDESPSLGEAQFNLAKHLDSPCSLDDVNNVNRVNNTYANLIHVPKNRMSLADHQAGTNYAPSVLPKNRPKKAATEIDDNNNNMGLHSNHQIYNLANLHSCFCRQIRITRNNLVAQVVNFSFVPLIRKSPISSFPPKNADTKSQPKNVAETKSYTLKKEMGMEKKLQVEERTPAFLKNLKKQGSLKPAESPSPLKEQTYPSSAQQIGTQEQKKSSFTSIQNPRFRQQGLMKMKVSDNQPTSTKKYELYNTSNRGAMGQSNTNWQTNSNFHQRHLTSASPLNQSKSTFIGSPQTKNTSPLKFFAPVQIIAPTVYVNSNGNESSNNIVLKLSQLHQNSPKFIRGQHQSPFGNKFQQSNNQSLQQIL